MAANRYLPMTQSCTSQFHPPAVTGEAKHSALLTWVASVHPESCAVGLMFTVLLCHTPGLAVWVLLPLPIACMTITLHTTNTSLPSPGKRDERGGFINLRALASHFGEAEADLCPSLYCTTGSKSSVLWEASGHPGKIISGSRWQLPAAVPCSLATSLATTKRGKRRERAV